MELSDRASLERLFEAFYEVGALPGGGVTRLGYTELEDEMHRRFAALAQELGCTVETDQAGNSYARREAAEAYVLIGSHLDSVIQGGRYDGVAGVMAGLLLLKRAKEAGLKLPLKVAAFRCEESSNFGCCTMGSGLVAHQLKEGPEKLAQLTGKNGERLGDVFARRGLSLTPPPIAGVREYLELHIEQGKVLEETGTRVGVVSTIAGPRRWKLQLKGLAEHSGATPMSMRQDALCAAAEIVLAVERIGQREATLAESVATVGVIQNTPNALNVVPGAAELGIDLRGSRMDSLDRMERDTLSAARDICARRHIALTESKLSELDPVSMDEAIQKGLMAAAKRLGISCRNMPSGAGHDAMAFAPLFPTGMVFIPCKKGISHNPLESATLESILDGADVLWEYVKGIE
jgi:N-carbamoyl-L-amino-acid hydrolase